MHSTQFSIFYTIQELSYTNLHVSSCSINANRFSWIYLPFLSLAYASVLQVTRGPYFICQITFVPSCPHCTRCVGCRPVFYVNKISRQEAINNFATENNLIYIYICVSCNFPLKYTIGKNVSVPRVTLLWSQLLEYRHPASFRKRLNYTECFMFKMLHFTSNWRKYLHKN